VAAVATTTSTLPLFLASHRSFIIDLHVADFHSVAVHPVTYDLAIFLQDNELLCDNFNAQHKYMCTAPCNKCAVYAHVCRTNIQTEFNDRLNTAFY
jgi:hypothetical protein